MRAVVVVPVLKQARAARSAQADSAISVSRLPESRLDEAKGLALADIVRELHAYVTLVRIR